jgi:putative ABC transport system ATP-binding protein
VLVVEGVSVVRGGRRVLDGVTASFAAGRCTALVGPSGSGKSTLLRLLDRLEEPTEGRVLLHGQDLRSYDVLALRRRVGLLQQAPVLLAVTVLEDLSVGRPMTAQDAAVLLTRVGLDGLPLDRDTGSLSGGEAQRLCLARALAVGPEVLLLDEPTSALDAASTERVESAVAGLAGRRTVVIVSHDHAQLARLCGDVVSLDAAVPRPAGVPSC